MIPSPVCHIKRGLNVLQMFLCYKCSLTHGTQMSHLMAWGGPKVWNDSFGFLSGALAFCGWQTSCPGDSNLGI